MVKAFSRFLLFLAVFPVLTQQQSTDKLDASAVYQRATPALVRVTVVDASGRVKEGSGVIVRSDGLIATNYHVIAEGLSARVQLSNGDMYDDVAIADTDERKDLALLKIKAVGLPLLEFADSDGLKVGGTVYVLGAPLGLEGSLSQGLIGAIRLGTEISPRLEGFRLIQFTAPVSPGSSGGPLLDESSKVAGLVLGTLPAGQNLNFAVPSNYINGLVVNWKGEARHLARMPTRAKSDRSRAPAEVLGAAKTLYVWVHSGSPVLKTEISKKLLNWGRLTLVSLPAEADLILEVVQTGSLNLGTGEGNQAAALLRDRESGMELWSTTKGGSWSMKGWSHAWVGRAIAAEFIRFYNSTTKSPPK